MAVTQCSPAALPGPEEDASKGPQEKTGRPYLFVVPVQKGRAYSCIAITIVTHVCEPDGSGVTFPRFNASASHGGTLPSPCVARTRMRTSDCKPYSCIGVVATSFIRRQNMMLSAYDPRPNNYYVNCSLGVYA